MKNPLFAAIDIKDKPCVIIGGGKVAGRKAKKLVKCGASVTVIAPHFTDELNDMAVRGQISRYERSYKHGDIAGAYLTVIATDNKDVNLEALDEANELGILVNAAFDKKYGNIFFAATKDVDGFTVSVMGEGASVKGSLDILERVCNSLAEEDKK